MERNERRWQGRFGQVTYTKHFKAGILVMEPLVLPIRKEEVEGKWLFVPANRRPGAGTRVLKCFPMTPEWSGQVTFFILDETITKEVFVMNLREAGSFIGVGRFEPSRGRFYGRFRIKPGTEVGWSDLTPEA